MFQTRYKIASLPIVIAYFIYPCLGLIFHVLDYDAGTVRDYLWLILFLLLFVPLKWNHSVLRYPKKIAVIVSVVLGILFFKFILGYLTSYTGTFYLRAFLMEIKGWLLILLAIFWMKKFGAIPLDYFKRGALFLSSLYILFFLYLIVLNDFSRFGLGSESNYDGLLILLGYIVALREEKFDKTKLILSAATFITLSRTGMLVWILVTMLRYRKEVKYIVLLIPAALAITWNLLLSQRNFNFSSLENTDRFIFLFQAQSIIREFDWVNLLFGSTPGMPISSDEIIPGFGWFITFFGDLNKIDGIHSFMFHSFWLRSALTLGIPFVLLLILYLLNKCFSRGTPIIAKYLVVLLLIQGFSLALFHLTLVGVPLTIFTLIVFYSDIDYSKDIRSYINHQTCT